MVAAVVMGIGVKSASARVTVSTATVQSMPRPGAVDSRGGLFEMDDVDADDVPEPSSLALAGLATLAGATAALRRIRRRRG